MTPHTTPDAAAISTSSADIIHQDAKTLDSPRSFSASIAAENRRRHNNTSTAARNAYQSRAYDRVIMQVKAGEKSILQQIAAKNGLSVNALLITAVNAQYGDILTPLAQNPYI